MTVLAFPVTRRTAVVSAPMLADGALIMASTPGMRPSPAEAALLTSRSMPEMPSDALPP